MTLSTRNGRPALRSGSVVFSVCARVDVGVLAVPARFVSVSASMPMLRNARNAADLAGPRFIRLGAAQSILPAMLLRLFRCSQF